jgi:hypothetical protein
VNLDPTRDITVWLIGFEQHKARPDLSDDTGFWLRVKAADASPFIEAYCFASGISCVSDRAARWQENVRLNCERSDHQIEEGPETRVLIRPHPSYGSL